VQTGQTYTYRVRAFNAGGDSGPTDEIGVQISSSGKIQVSTAKVNFGKSSVNKTKTKTFKIKNTGSGNLLGVVGSLEAPFRILSGGGAFNLAPGRNIVVKVEFSPSATGQVAQTLAITSTDSVRRTVNVSVTGNATAKKKR
jgi:hypothetical protein